MSTKTKATKSAKPKKRAAKKVSKPKKTAMKQSIPFEFDPEYIECQKDGKPIEALFEELLANTEDSKTIFLDIYGVDDALVVWLVRLCSKDNIVRVQCQLRGSTVLVGGALQESTLQKKDVAIFGPLVPFGCKATNKLWKNKIVFDTDTCVFFVSSVLCFDDEIIRFYIANFNCVPGVVFVDASIALNTCF